MFGVPCLPHHFFKLSAAPDEDTTLKIMLNLD